MGLKDRIRVNQFKSLGLKIQDNPFKSLGSKRSVSKWICFHCPWLWKRNFGRRPETGPTGWNDCWVVLLLTHLTGCSHYWSGGLQGKSMSYPRTFSKKGRGFSDLDSIIYLVSIYRTNIASILKRRLNTHSFIEVRHCHPLHRSQYYRVSKYK